MGDLRTDSWLIPMEPLAQSQAFVAIAFLMLLTLTCPVQPAGLIRPGKMFAKDPDSGRQDNGIVLDALDLQ